jgi:hypothetical protein
MPTPELYDAAGRGENGVVIFVHGACCVSCCKFTHCSKQHTACVFCGDTGTDVPGPDMEDMATDKLDCSRRWQGLASATVTSCTLQALEVCSSGPFYRGGPQEGQGWCCTGCHDGCTHVVCSQEMYTWDVASNMELAPLDRRGGLGCNSGRCWWCNGG